MKKVLFYILLIYNFFAQSMYEDKKILIIDGIEKRKHLKYFLNGYNNCYFENCSLQKKYKDDFDKLKLSAKPFIVELFELEKQLEEIEGKKSEIKLNELFVKVETTKGQVSKILSDLMLLGKCLHDEFVIISGKKDS